MARMSVGLGPEEHDQEIRRLIRLFGFRDVTITNRTMIVELVSVEDGMELIGWLRHQSLEISRSFRWLNVGPI